MKNGVCQSSQKKLKTSLKEQSGPPSKSRREKLASVLSASLSTSATGPNKVDLVKLVLEQSQKITKLEGKIKKNEFANVAVRGARELLRCANTSSEADILELAREHDRLGARKLMKENIENGASAREDGV